VSMAESRACLARRLTLGALLLVPACATDPRQARFGSADEAVRQLIAAARAEDVAQLEEIFGAGSRGLVHSGDDVADRAGRQRFVEAFDQKHALVENADGSMTLLVGDVDWPFPIPLVDADGAWHFDTAAGQDEILDRRIGRNELDTIQTCLAVCDAQEEYALADRDEDGLLEYAAAIVSRPGQRDGLYWKTEDGEASSPLGPLVADSVEAGYGGSGATTEARPVHGYYFRILKAQGPSAPGGARDYVVHGSMLAGYSLLAVPAEYGNSGVMSFMVNQDRIVYQADLGPDTAAKAATIQAFDPAAPLWQAVSR